MTDNEKLIEEAAKAIQVETWEPSCRGAAEAAFRVFEKAHTPTDDGREALIRVLHRARRQPDVRDEALADVILAHFRHPVVPEQSAEVLSDWFTSSHGVAVAAVEPMTDRGPSVMVDGRVISPNDVAALVEFKTQGEPSDAQVEAALDAWESAGGPDAERLGFRAMRAALRAASAVTEQGEG